MSADEPFLARWSRRKLEPNRDTAEEGAPQPAVAPARDPETAVETAQPPQAADQNASDPSVVEQQAVDLKNLPSLESIDAATDIRGFLARGVPTALSRAALRRAWAADPAIRDFIGLSENAWDFTAPDGVPGFGPLAPGTTPLSLANLAGEPAVVDLPSTGGSDVPDPHAADDRTELDPRPQELVHASSHHANVTPEKRGASPSPDHAGVNSGRIAGKSFEDVATREASLVRDPDSIVPRRRHGGALPS